MVSPDNQSSFKIIGKTLFHLFLFWLFSFFIFLLSFFQSKEIGPTQAFLVDGVIK